MWGNYFYPTRPDLIAEAGKLAATLGGRLELAPVRRKYAWIGTLFGNVAAHRAQTVLPNLKASALRSWDGLMFRLGR
jgi:hypothetical protein